MQKREFGSIGCALAVVLLIAGCGQNDQPLATARTGTDASSKTLSDTKQGLAITNPRLVLPAVSGRPGAVYFKIVNTGGTATTLVSAAVRGAGEAQMHETSGGTMTAIKEIAVPAGGNVAFAPGGRHVMVFGLPADLHPGDTATLSLNFSDGKSISTPLTALAPGTIGHDDMAGMTMDH